jgi:hypothetical protein
VSLRSGIVPGIALVSALAAAPSHGMPAPPPGPLRSPQVPVLTNHLQSLLDGWGESINVGTDQRAQQTMTAAQFACRPPYSWQLELWRSSASTDSIGIYNAAEATPLMMRIFPAEAVSGWFAIISFRTAPARLVVDLFDQSANLVGVLKYLGVDQTSVAFWLQGAAGPFYMEDARNPGGVAQVLWFAGTGIDFGGTWICMEDQLVGAGSDQDYADAVLWIDFTCGGVPVRKSTWGAVKQRFR